MKTKRKWTEEEIKTLYQEHIAGESLASLGQKYGVSRQRIAQLVGGTGDRYYTIKRRSKYPGLDNWMVKNRITYAYLCKLMGYKPSVASQVRVGNICQGEIDPRKKDIDKLIKISGLSYEELFAEVE